MTGRPHPSQHPARTRSRGRRLRGDSGYVTGIVLAILPALLIAAALVVDGGRQIDTRRDVHGVAAVAARAGAQMTPDELFAGQLDPTLAADRAVAVTSAAGYSANVTVTENTVTVAVAGTVEFVMLSVVGIHRRTVTGTASATVLAGVNEGVNP